VVAGPRVVDFFGELPPLTVEFILWSWFLWLYL